MEGTPQGGIISPTLANATLDGMEKSVKEKFHKRMENGKMDTPKVNLIRYADDFVVTAQSRETLEEIKVLITEFLAQRGLALSEEKTLITHISEGFDFLGFNIKKYKNGKLLIKPSQKSQNKITEKLHQVIFSNKSATQCLLIELLNPVITGWGNYFRHAVSKEVFAKIDHILVQQLKRWAFRRHSNKSRKWVIEKYFKVENNRKWVFKDSFEWEGKQKDFKLKKLVDIPIIRHVKIKKDANPFDTQWNTYFENRSRKATAVRRA